MGGAIFVRRRGRGNQGLGAAGDQVVRIGAGLQPVFGAGSSTARAQSNYSNIAVHNKNRFVKVELPAAAREGGGEGARHERPPSIRMNYPALAGHSPIRLPDDVAWMVALCPFGMPDTVEVTSLANSVEA